jgi:hypothetical protein
LVTKIIGGYDRQSDVTGKAGASTSRNEIHYLIAAAAYG